MSPRFVGGSRDGLPSPEWVPGIWGIRGGGVPAGSPPILAHSSHAAELHLTQAVSKGTWALGSPSWTLWLPPAPTPRSPGTAIMVLRCGSPVLSYGSTEEPGGLGARYHQLGQSSAQRTLFPWEEEGTEVVAAGASCGAV